MSLVHARVIAKCQKVQDYPKKTGYTFFVGIAMIENGIALQKWSPPMRHSAIVAPPPFFLG
jgi:hypothetical protein